MYEDSVLEKTFFDQLSEKIVRLIPADIERLNKDMQKNIRAVLQSAFSRLDLVSREDYDVQVALLKRTRAKLEAMEERVSALEDKLKQ